MTDTDPVARLRTEILRATLPHVPFDGWTMAAAARGVVEAGYKAGDATRAFPGGAIEMIEFFNRLADREMVAEMEKRGVSALKIRERVGAGVRIRLEQAAAHRETIRRAMTILVLPQNAAVAAKCVYRTVDAIWYAAGDTATDYNFYTKRGLLAGVYGSTVLFWLNDNSEDFSASWAFLDRRITDVMAVPKALGAITERLQAFPNPFEFLARGGRHRSRGARR